MRCTPVVGNGLCRDMGRAFNFVVQLSCVVFKLNLCFVGGRFCAMVGLEHCSLQLAPCILASEKLSAIVAPLGPALWTAITIIHFAVKYMTDQIKSGGDIRPHKLMVSMVYVITSVGKQANPIANLLHNDPWLTLPPFDSPSPVPII